MNLRTPSGIVRLGLIILLVTAAAGCAMSPTGVTLFPTGHFLTRTARQIAEASPTPAALPRELQKAVLPVYYIEPGDLLLIEPVDLAAPIRLPIDQPVLVDGTIDLGPYGRLVVAGLTIDEVEQQVEDLIRSVEGTDVRISARLIAHPGAVYYVLGEVNAPGAYPLIGRETVLDGILAAGGLTQRASTCDILFTRPTHPASCRVVQPICYRQITQLGDTATNYQLMPGDRIFVGTRTIWEELMFWRATADCPWCTGLQCPCPDAGLAGYQNPFLSRLPPLEELPPEMLGPSASLPAGHRATVVDAAR